MNETDVRQKIYRLLYRDLDLAPVTQTDASRCQHCGRLTKPPIGRPDILLVSEVVEVKVLRAGESSFPMDRIDEKQRKWLNRWLEKKRPGFIGLGVIRAHGKREHLDHLFIIPWATWLEAEEQVRPYQESIPLQAEKGFKRELQDNNLDILTLFQDYELIREDRKWHLPTTLG